jgi:putative phage-type endonuclease
MNHIFTRLEVGTPDWLEAHKGKISGGTAAAILGAQGAFGTPLSAWASITGRETTPDGPFLKWGRYAEPMAAAWWRDDHPEMILFPSPGMIQHATLPWLAGTPDGAVREEGWSAPPLDDLAEGPDVWEGKSAFFSKRAQWEDDNIPQAYRVQTQIYAELMDSERIWFAALVQPDCYQPTLFRNQDFIDKLLDYLSDWHEKYVVKDIEPPATAKDNKILADLHPQDNGRSIFLMGDAIPRPDELAERDLDLKARVKELEILRDEVHAKVKQAIGENTFGQVDGERRYAWKTSKNGQRRLTLGKIKPGECLEDIDA